MLRILLAAGLALLPLPLYGQRVGHELAHGLDDIEDVWTSPSALDGHDIPGILLVVAPSAASVLIDEPVQRWVDSHQRSLPVLLLAPFRNGQLLNRLGNASVLEGASVLAYLGGLVFDSQDLRDAGRGCLSGTLANTVVRHVVGAYFGRARPSTGQGAFSFNPGLHRKWEERSLPNGHGANAITCMSFLAHRFDLGAAEPVMYGLATGVALSRIADDAHWLSDTLLGLGFGFAVGKDVARGQLERRHSDDVLQPQGYLSLTFRF